LDQLRDTLQAQVEDHFEVLVKALNERKLALTSQINDHVTELRSNLQKQQEKNYS